MMAFAHGFMAGVRARARYLLIVPAVTLLSACSDSGVGDLHQFVSEAKQRQGRVEPLPEFEPVETYAYSALSLRDPFGSWSQDAKPTAQARAGNGLSPDISRRKEVLEAYPLDALRMLGTLKFQEATWGLVKAPDGIVHRVRMGNHMGQNYGKVKAIQAQRLTLTEIVPDGLGGWEERESYLAMNEQ